MNINDEYIQQYSDVKKRLCLLEYNCTLRARMAESLPYENKAHRAAKLVIPCWPGWKHLREKLQYAAYYKVPNSKVIKVYAYAHSPMRPTGWMELFQYQKYFKIEGLFEANERYQTLKKQGNLTEFGTPPSLRGPRPSCVKSGKNEDGLHEDKEVKKPGTPDSFWSILGLQRPAGSESPEPEETEKMKVVQMLARKYEQARMNAFYAQMSEDDECARLAPLVSVELAGRLEEGGSELLAGTWKWREAVIAALNVDSDPEKELAGEEWLRQRAKKKKEEGKAENLFQLLLDMAAGELTSEDVKEIAEMWKSPANKTLSYNNLQAEALRYYEINRTRYMDHLSDRLEDTLAAMTEDGWILAPRLMKDLRMKRVDPTYYEEFTARVRGGTVLTAAFFSRANTANTYNTKRAVDHTRTLEEGDSRGPRKRARASEEDEAAAEASASEPEAVATEEHAQREDKENKSRENKERRAQASAAAAARAMLAVRAAWGQHQNVTK
jgi:hypothetical protein